MEGGERFEKSRLNQGTQQSGLRYKEAVKRKRHTPLNRQHGDFSLQNLFHATHIATLESNLYPVSMNRSLS